jgi:hypothetical protein
VIIANPYSSEYKEIWIARELTMIISMFAPIVIQNNLLNKKELKDE